MNKFEAEAIKNVAVYTRVSTEEQAHEGFSLDNQLDKLRHYCKARDWNIIGEYVDGGYSGRNTRRPNYQEMLQDMDKWDAIVIIKMDRIHRNSINFNKMMVDLGKHHKQFVSMQESFDTSTAMGRFFMDMTQRIAQLESEMIGERVFTGQHQKAKDDTSGFMGHRVPFGYKWDSKNKKFIEVHQELDIVRNVFQMYEDGFSMREIGSKIGKSNTTVKYYLHNCFYAGLERWCHLFKKANIEPIITVDQFNKCQQLMRDRCHSHKNYKPMLIKDKNSFKLSNEDRKAIPVINRAKHNYSF